MKTGRTHEMKKCTDIFAKEFEVPDIVKERMEEAFVAIERDGKEGKSQRKRGDSTCYNIGCHGRAWIFRYPQVAAVLCIGILLVGGTTAYAAYTHFWSRGMKGTLQSTELQRQTLTEDGTATVFPETPEYADMAVTDGGITVTPDTMVVNDKIGYFSFTVDGYRLPEGEEPCFEFVDVYLGDNPESESGWVNMGASFYDGIVAGEDGTAMYEDGTPIQFDEKGRIISLYTDENGRMEYVVTVMVSRAEDSLLGKTLHINFTNLGTTYKAGFTPDISGEWDYALSLPTVSSMEEITVGKEVRNTVFEVETVEISPVAVKVNYAVNGEVESVEDDLRIPQFCGFVLEDGTELTGMADGRMSGFSDETRSGAYCISAFDRVIATEQITALILRTEGGLQTVEITPASH